MPSAQFTFGAAIVSVVLVFCAYVAGVLDVLDAGGVQRAFWMIVFPLSAAALLGTIVLSIYRIAQRRDGVIAVATVLVPVIPLIWLALMGTLG